jgi:transcriptional regulator with XRE-family HTH domain
MREINQLHKIGSPELKILCFNVRMATDRKSVAKRLRLLQKALGIELDKDMAELAGASPGEWSEILALKRDLSKNKAFELATDPGVSLDWLYRGDVDSLRKCDLRRDVINRILKAS